MGIETALLATAAVGAVSGIAGGLQQKKMYKQQADQASMAAEANITDRTRALNEAMAMQNAMMGSSGRGMESVGHIIEGDKARFEQEKKLIRATSNAQSVQAKQAGQSAAASGIASGASQLGMGLYQYSMLGGGSGMTTQQSQAKQQATSAAHRTPQSKW